MTATCVNRSKNKQSPQNTIQSQFSWDRCEGWSSKWTSVKKRGVSRLLVLLQSVLVQLQWWRENQRFTLLLPNGFHYGVYRIFMMVWNIAWHATTLRIRFYTVIYWSKIGKDIVRFTVYSYFGHHGKCGGQIKELFSETDSTLRKLFFATSKS